MTLAALMLGACELAEQELGVRTTSYEPAMTGVGEISQIEVAQTVPGPEEQVPGQTEQIDLAAPVLVAKADRAYLSGCLDENDLAALQQPLDGIWEPSDGGCELVAVLLDEAWRISGRGQKNQEDEQLFGRFIQDGMAEQTASALSNEHGLTASEEIRVTGAEFGPEDIIVEMIIPPDFAE